MRIILLIAVIQVCTFPAWAINYYRCSKTEDCAKAYGGCGRYESVHKRYKELYDAKARKGDTVANCLAPTAKDYERNEKGQPICRKNKCFLIIPKKEK